MEVPPPPPITPLLQRRVTVNATKFVSIIASQMRNIRFAKEHNQAIGQIRYTLNERLRIRKLEVSLVHNVGLSF